MTLKQARQVKCTCSSFTLQFDGCTCGRLGRIYRLKKALENDRREISTFRYKYGHSGILRTSYGTWRAYVSVNGESVHIKTCKTKGEAIAAREAWEG